MVLQSALAYERAVMGENQRRRGERAERQAVRTADEAAPAPVPDLSLIELTRSMGGQNDPMLRQRLAQLHCLVQVNEWNNRRAKAELAQGTTSSVVSLGKLAMSRILHTAGSLQASVLGAEAMLGGESSPRAADATYAMLNAFFHLDRRRDRPDPTQHHRRADPGPAQGARARQARSVPRRPQGHDMKWSNWSGRQTSDPQSIVNPTTLDEMRAAVAIASANAWVIRAVGASHSHSRVAASDGMVIETDGWGGVVGTEHRPEGPVATVRAGTRIHQLGPPLHRAGLALRNQGDIDRQSVAGAIATGTHGTGPTLGNFSSSVVGLRILLADGSIVDCGPTVEPELFAAARHSLGGIGVVTEVDLAVRPRYLLHERLWSDDPDDVMARVDELIAATRHFEFFWAPQVDRCACKSLDELTDDAVAGPTTSGDGPPGAGKAGDDWPEDHIDVLSKRERRGWSHRIISSIRDDRHTEMEYSVPAEAGPACFQEVRAMILERFPDLQWPLEYRTLASDDVLLSTARARPTVTISAHQDVALDDRSLFEACAEIFDRHDGRPHWGKVHYKTGTELAALHDDYERWWTIRDRHDPDGLFLTGDLSRLRP